MGWKGWTERVDSDSESEINSYKEKFLQKSQNSYKKKMMKKRLINFPNFAEKSHQLKIDKMIWNFLQIFLSILSKTDYM